MLMAAMSASDTTLRLPGRRPKRLDSVIQAGLVRAAVAKIVLTQTGPGYTLRDLPCTSSGRSSSGSSQV
jgi:hypothetical protein